MFFLFVRSVAVAEINLIDGWIDGCFMKIFYSPYMVDNILSSNYLVGLPKRRRRLWYWTRCWWYICQSDCMAHEGDLNGGMVSWPYSFSHGINATSPRGCRERIPGNIRSAWDEMSYIPKVRENCYQIACITDAYGATSVCGLH